VLARIESNLAFIHPYGEAYLFVARRARRIKLQPLRRYLEYIDQPKFQELILAGFYSGLFSELPYCGLTVGLALLERARDELPEPILAHDAPQQQILAPGIPIGENNDLNRARLLWPHA
jgi:hypothetical protein